MKKILFIILSVTSMVVFSQISTREVAPPKEKEPTIEYDSTLYYNYRAKDYIGQRIQIKPSLSSSERHRFIDLCGTQKFDITPYYNKLLIVSGISDFNYSKFSNLSFNDSPALVLLDPTTDTPICMVAHNSMYSTDLPFITLSFYNYLKSEFLNERVYVDPYCVSSHDINTGEKIPDIEKKKWTCFDVQFKNSYYDKYELFLFIRSEEGYESDIEVSYLDRKWTGEGRKKLYSNKEWIKYGKKYGYDTMRKVIRGKIQVGMPLELLYLAWGFPSNVEQLTSDIWLYTYYDEYVYIRYKNDTDAYIVEYN